ncbi:MAG: hypothetical protein LBN11_02500 [Tannerella sp.]|jgi:hypothetical protein|nr:hypothetical protein [Tannerella sp.]
MRKNIVIVVVSFLFSGFFLSAQTNGQVLYLNDKKLTLDSLSKVISDEDISYQTKINTFYTSEYKREPEKEKQIEVINNLLAESKKEMDIDGILFIYVYLAYLYYTWENEKLFNIYADSADIYAEDAKNPLSLGHYHFTKGTQAIHDRYGRREGYKQFELAIDYFSGIKNETRSIASSLYNITIYTANQPDTTSSKRIIGKIEKLLDKDYSVFIEFLLFSMKSDLYHEYFNASGDEMMLDSAMSFEKQRITLYNSDTAALPEGIDYDILQSYLLLAEYGSQTKNQDWEFINGCIENAEKIDCTDDSYILSRIQYTKAIMYFGRKKFEEAEKCIKNATKFLDIEIKAEEDENMYPPESFYSDEIAYADLYCRILSAQGKYKEALAYNNSKNELKRKLQISEQQEIEYLYNTEKEELKIAQLEKQKYQQFKSNTMLITSIALFIALIILLWSWLRTIDKNFKNHYRLVSAEKQNAEINLNINEERARKSLLERYEVLSDNRLKEIEIEGKNREIKTLLKEKEALDAEIETFKQKIAKIEEKTEGEKALNISDINTNKLILDELTKLIAKKLPQKPEYVDALQNIDNEYITLLKKSYAGNLSISNIKYCLCFVIRMEISEVAECFAIEQSSVHVLRYRLKKIFCPNNNDNLDDFLIRLKEK